mgnify:CR=1 FL=1
MKKILILLLFSIPFIGFGQNIFLHNCFENYKSEERINYWENGQKLSEIHYFNGKIEGACKYWYKTGQVKNVGFYKNGKMIGSFISYYDNGQIESHGDFRYDEFNLYSRKDGVCKHYYHTGK